MLARELGRLHVDQMLAELTPEEFNEWWASAILDGWDSEGQWRRIGTIAAAAHNAGVRTAAACGLKARRDDIRTPDDYIPKLKPEKPQIISDAAAENLLREAWG